ncbi:P1 family peptidase [Pseudoprimorskyibacter insulae]|uniref:Putative aminopeptidase n=1 Tax=Pseudoprimorskyibacter insulae TaxID=1695997 RepID=A0A2R8AUN0_9RHOB|nr:P1 family peptidase [Pseudoprimorskyibacter insulae]SPF79743.1 putative aminopeptidase [Pseudoprimorskyibacter insulae]
MKPGPLNLITDVTGLRVGNAQDDTLKSGTTVLTADAPFACSYSVMGGAPGTRETDLLEPDKSVAGVDALVLSGGSAFGLAAAQGVMDALYQQGRGFPVFTARVPIVPSAIIFDLLNGGQKDWGENPYPALGRAALANAGTTFNLGSVGAGTGAQTAMHKGGLGSASVVLPSGATVGALVAANPVGSVTTPSGRHFHAAPYEMGGEFGALGPDPTQGFQPNPPSRKFTAMMELANTTIAIVATDVALTKAECKRVATAAHDGMARAIVPAHTPHDGDLIFAASTGARPMASPLEVTEIGHAAAVCLARAIARAVWEATPADDDTLPTFRSEMGLT